MDDVDRLARSAEIRLASGWICRLQAGFRVITISSTKIWKRNTVMIRKASASKEA